ncbi:hypothetical protein [Pseudogemmobacter sonorensis]|uniref:hypothetical protein n=1 Tax=Pseudogemmobacter sonorensis TaxID=2989681 RepID=UPI00369E4055
MADKQRAPYLQVAFPGPVGRVSEGTWDGRWTRRAYVDLGPFRVRGVVADAQMGSALEEFGDSAATGIRLGHMLVGRWVLAVTSEGHSERQGMVMFLLCNLALTLAFAILSALFAVVASDLGGARSFQSWLMLPGLALWALQMWLNFKARFGG